MSISDGDGVATDPRAAHPPTCPLCRAAADPGPTAADYRAALEAVVAAHGQRHHHYVREVLLHAAIEDAKGLLARGPAGEV